MAIGTVIISLHRLTRGLKFEVWECSLPLVNTLPSCGGLNADLN